MICNNLSRIHFGAHLSLRCAHDHASWGYTHRGIRTNPARHCARNGPHDCLAFFAGGTTAPALAASVCSKKQAATPHWKVRPAPRSAVQSSTRVTSPSSHERPIEGGKEMRTGIIQSSRGRKRAPLLSSDSPRFPSCVRMGEGSTPPERDGTGS